MAKKAESMSNVLGLLPPTSSGNGSGATYGLAVSSGSPLSKTEQSIYQEARKQEIVIGLQTAKTTYAGEKIDEIRQRSADGFHRFMDHQEAINAAVQGKPIQPYVEEFNHHNAQAAAQNQYELMQVGVGRILEEVKRSLYQEEIVEPRRSALQRWLGG